MNRFLCQVLGLLLMGVAGVASQSVLQHRNQFLLEHWTFHKGDVHSAESPRLFSSDGWQEVTVPHTWNATDVLTEGERYYQGIGWYRTSFASPRDEHGTRTFIRFDGVSLVADVFLNGAYVGKHRGGYSAFCFEITSYLVYGEHNVLSVKVDNTMQPDVAPSGTHLYPLFGGIHRPVTVFHTNDLCVSPLDYASSGVTVRPLQVSKEEAEIAVETLLNYRHEPVLQTASPELLPPKGMKGRGLYGEYFENNAFQGKPKHARIDEAVSFNYGRFFPEPYQRLYHEKVWAEIKNRKDIWCKFIWNLADFSWTTVRRGDRDFINHKGLITHDRQVKKEAFYFYKANWSNEPVLYLLSRRNTERTEKLVPVEVYTNLDEVELYVNGIFISRKKLDSDIHKIRWDNVPLAPGRNRIDVIGHQADKTYTDASECRL